MEGSPSQSPPPFYERRGFQGAVAVVGLLTALWALVGAPKPWSVASDITRTETALSNTTIVLDTSSAMRKPFGKGTKLDAAKDAIAKFAASASSSGLALRQTGGGCYEDGEVVVGIGAEHGDDVRDAVASAHPSGVSNVINTVRGAIDEFTSERFQRDSSTRRVVVFMGGEDECIGAAGAEITQALEGLGVDTSFRMYTLGMTKREVARMHVFRREVASLADVEVVHVESEKQFEEAVDQEVDAIDEGRVPEPVERLTPEGEEGEGEVEAGEEGEGPQRQGIEGPVEEEGERTTEIAPTVPETETGEGEAEVAPAEGSGVTEETTPEETVPGSVLPSGSIGAGVATLPAGAHLPAPLLGLAVGGLDQLLAA